MCGLPRSLVCLVMNFLNTVDRIKIRSTCSEWMEYVTDPAVWEEIEIIDTFKVGKRDRCVEIFEIFLKTVKDRGFCNTRSLIIRWCFGSSIAMKGAKLVQRMINMNRGTLEKISVSGNRFGSHGLKLMLDGIRAESLQNVAELDIGLIELSGELGGEAAAEMVNLCPNLQILNIEGFSLGNFFLGNDGLSAMVKVVKPESLLKLKHFNMADCKAEGEIGGSIVAKLLNQCKLMETIVINKNALENEGLKSIDHGLVGNMAYLRELKLTNCRIHHAKGCELLAAVLNKCRALSTLHINKNRLSNEGLHWLLSRTKKHVWHKLYELRISECNLEGEHGGAIVADLISVCRCLRNLDIENNNFDNDGLRALIGSSRLEAFQNLQELNVGFCRLTFDGGQVIGDLLNFNPELSCLCVKGNGLNNRELQLLSKTVRKQVGVMKELNIGFNHLEGEEGGRVIASLVNCISGVERLDLFSNQLTKLGILKFFSCLQKDKMLLLKCLNIGYCGILNEEEEIIRQTVRDWGANSQLLFK